jgi:integrase
MGRAYRRGGGSGRFGLHRLRHLWGTTAAEEGMHPRISQEIMGQQDEKSQRIYQHPSAAVVKAEHAKITPIRGIKRARRRKLA